MEKKKHKKLRDTRLCQYRKGVLIASSTSGGHGGTNSKKLRAFYFFKFHPSSVFLATKTKCLAYIFLPRLHHFDIACDRDPQCSIIHWFTSLSWCSDEFRNIFAKACAEKNASVISAKWYKNAYAVTAPAITTLRYANKAFIQKIPKTLRRKLVKSDRTRFTMHRAKSSHDCLIWRRYILTWID